MTQKTQNRIKTTVLVASLAGGLSVFQGCNSGSKDTTIKGLKDTAPKSQTAIPDTSTEATKVTNDPFSATCDQIRNVIVSDMKKARDDIKFADAAWTAEPYTAWAARATAVELEANNLLRVYDSKGCKEDQKTSQKK